MFLRRLLVFILFLPLVALFMVQLVIGILRFLFTGYNFLEEEDPIFLTVSLKILGKTKY